VNSRWLKARQTKYAMYAMVYVIVILAIVAVGNVLANRYNRSYDSTTNKRYSLSEQTAKIVRGVKQAVKITYFDQSSKLQEGKDLLDRYANLSPKVQIDYVDPDKNPQAARAANVASYGVSVVQIGTRQEQAKTLDEENITGAIIRALKTDKHTVCFITGDGERQIDDTDRNGFSRFKELLGQENYGTKSINLLEKAEVPADCTVLVVGGPRSDYQQPAVEAISKYIENGGRGLFLLDPPLKAGPQPVADNDALTGLLAKWGVTVDKDLLLDLNPIGQLAGVGPQVVLVTKYDYHTIVNDLKGTATGFPLTRSLEIKKASNTIVDKLFDSSPSSVATTKLNEARIDPNDPQNKRGAMTLAAAGRYGSEATNKEGRFVVVGSSTWAANSFINFNGNSDLALNTVNWLASDEDLISIRPKQPEDRRVTMTRSQMNLVRISSQFILPSLLLVMGVAVWWRRR
jgi:ABC-type uncharacterized transport system involved in gliding motility auxiliary subunit